MMEEVQKMMEIVLKIGKMCKNWGRSWKLVQWG